MFGTDGGHRILGDTMDGDIAVAEEFPLFRRGYRMKNDARDTVLRDEYRSRINRVLDYLECRLGEPLTLEELAGVANFSPFHFHRIFAALTGETPGRFIQRLRVEKAAGRLIDNPRASITDIALDCGFSGSAAFARAFREAFGMSASVWRARHRKECTTDRNGGQTDGKGGKASTSASMYLDAVTHQFAWRIAMNDRPITVEVRERPDVTVAYVRHVGPYKGDSALFERLFTRICTWAGPRGLIRPGETLFYSVYHDNPDITDEDKLRISVGLSVPADTPVDGGIGLMTISGGKIAEAHFELQPTEYMDAWNAVYGEWLPASGYQPDDRPCFERYPLDAVTPKGTHIVDICVPVRPL